jgi:hypothetical protein
MRGQAGIFVIIGILVVAFLGFAYYMGFFNISRSALPSPSPTYETLSEDPKYRDVKEKYNLNEEQLQILSTVNPEDNE